MLSHAIIELSRYHRLYKNVEQEMKIIYSEKNSGYSKDDSDLFIIISGYSGNDCDLSL